MVRLHLLLTILLAASLLIPFAAANEDPFHYLCLMKITTSGLSIEKVWKVPGKMQRLRQKKLPETDYRIVISDGSDIVQQIHISDPFRISIPPDQTGSPTVSSVTKAEGVFTIRLLPQAVGNTLSIFKKERVAKTLQTQSIYKPLFSIELTPDVFKQAIVPSSSK